jgi:hypothetical protein
MGGHYLALPFLALYVIGAGYMGGMSVKSIWTQMRESRRRPPRSPGLATALPRGD